MQELPISEAIAAVLATGDVQKRKSIREKLQRSYSVGQVEAGLKKLLEDGRVRKIKSGYYALVSPYEVAEATTALDGEIFQLIEQVAFKPTLFEGFVRWHWIPRSVLWRCVAQLTQQGRLKMMVDGPEGEGIRFTASSATTDIQLVPPVDISALSASGVMLFRMAQLEKAARLTSRMIQNRLAKSGAAEFIRSFILRDQRYVIISPSKNLAQAGILVYSRPVGVSVASEFGPEISCWFAGFDSQRLSKPNSHDQLDSQLVRSGLALDQANGQLGLTETGRLLARYIARNVTG